MRVLALGILALVAVAALGQQPPCVAPAPPVISVRFLEGFRAQFTAESSSGAFQACDTFAWDFDDGSPIVTEQNPVHVFPSPGRYTIRLTIINPRGTATAQGRITIEGTLLPFILDFRAYVLSTGDQVVLTWATRNTTSIRIDPLNYRDPARSGSIVVPIHGRREFTLVAIGAAGQTSRTITVTTGPAKRRAVRH